MQYGTHLSLAARAVFCLDPLYGRQIVHGRGLLYYRKVLVQIQPEAVVPKGSRLQQGYRAMTWVRSPVCLNRQAAAQIRITVPFTTGRWLRDKVAEFKQSIKASDASVQVIDVAATQVRQTLGKFLPRRFKTIALYITPLSGQSAWLIHRLRNDIVQAGHGFWFDFEDACPADLCFSPITVDPEVALHAVSKAAAHWAVSDVAVAWDFPHKGWLLLADPPEEAYHFA